MMSRVTVNLQKRRKLGQQVLGLVGKQSVSPIAIKELKRGESTVMVGFDTGYLRHIKKKLFQLL
jgi:fido (protein-threonine AMPylation protein)